MDSKDSHVMRLCIDEQQMQALLELERTTHQSVASLIREGIELYLRSKRNERAPEKEQAPASFPIVFDRSYRPGQ